MNCPIPNENLIDRLIRSLVALILAMFGYFWLGSYWQIAVYILAAIMLFTAASGFCGLYKLLKWDTTRLKWRPKAKIVWPIFVITFLVVALAGGYASMFFTRKIFIEDFNRMNGPYKQTLFMTGQNNREESVKNYATLMVEYAKFSTKYSTYHPYFLKGDKLFAGDIKNAGDIISGLKDAVAVGDLPQAHKEFERVRPIFQDMLKRNGFSMLAVYLVDFHDAMETVIAAADAKNPNGVIEAYGQADAKLKEVETVANDEEIQLIRTNLNKLKVLAEEKLVEELPARAAELKSSFVKVYLKRG